jgi:hypothetical protein
VYKWFICQGSFQTVLQLARSNSGANDDTSVSVPGALQLFSNVVEGRFTDRPNTILVDSQQLESGEAMSAEFKKMCRFHSFPVPVPRRIQQA